MLNLNFTLT